MTYIEHEHLKQTNKGSRLMTYIEHELGNHPLTKGTKDTKILLVYHRPEQLGFGHVISKLRCLE